MVPNGKSLVTPVFKNIDSTKKFDLNGIKVLNNENAEFDTSAPTSSLTSGKVTIKKLSTAGAFMDTYTFIWTSSKKGWYNSTGSTKILDTVVTFENGEGMLVANNWKTDTPVYFQTSGEVDLLGENAVPYNKSLSGNALPRELDLTEVKILNNEKNEFDTSSPTTSLTSGKFTIKKLSTEGAFEDTYTFIWTGSKKGWYNSTGSTAVKVGQITFRPGEAFLVTNTWKTDTLLYIDLPDPTTPMPVPEK